MGYVIHHRSLMHYLTEAAERKKIDSTTYRELMQLTDGGVIASGGPDPSEIKMGDRVEASLRLNPNIAGTRTQPQAAEVPAVVQADSGFKFGASSERELVGVNSELVSCARLALRYSTQDFSVFDGLRTAREQERLVATGQSKTMQSKHLIGRAVDLVPYIGGKLVWDWEGCYRIAMAMDKAATELGIAHLITWGGAWDRKLSDFGGDVGEYKKAVSDYNARKNGKGFLDGPHFEID